MHAVRTVAWWSAAAVLAFLGGGMLSGGVVWGIVGVTMYKSFPAGKEEMLLATMAVNAFHLGGLIAILQLALSRRRGYWTCMPLTVGLVTIAIAAFAFGADIGEAAELTLVGCTGLVPAALFGWWASKTLVDRQTAASARTGTAPDRGST